MKKSRYIAKLAFLSVTIAAVLGLFCGCFPEDESAYEIEYNEGESLVIKFDYVETSYYLKSCKNDGCKVKYVEFLESRESAFYLNGVVTDYPVSCEADSQGDYQNKGATCTVVLDGDAAITFEDSFEIKTEVSPEDATVSTPELRLPEPVEVDSDGDGYLDSKDNCPTRPNPTQNDFDTDGVGDACDNCFSVGNPGQEDADNDELGDACIDDMDHDGVVDDDDNCPNVANPDQANSDDDMRGDACDTVLVSEDTTLEPPTLNSYAGGCSMASGAASSEPFVGLMLLVFVAGLISIRRMA